MMKFTVSYNVNYGDILLFSNDLLVRTNLCFFLLKSTRKIHEIGAAALGEESAYIQGLLYTLAINFYTINFI